MLQSEGEGKGDTRAEEEGGGVDEASNYSILFYLHHFFRTFRSGNKYDLERGRNEKRRREVRKTWRDKKIMN